MKKEYINPSVEVATFASTDSTNLILSNQAASNDSLAGTISKLQSKSINDLKE